MANCAVLSKPETFFWEQLQSSRQNLNKELMKRYFDERDATDPKIFAPKTKIFPDNKNLIRKIEVGEKNHESDPMRVILLVGGTGSGKSMLINAMYNHMCGVEWEDTFRMKLIDEGNRKSQAHSQTEWVTAYVVHHQPWFTIPYTLILIDTPGLGDTTGIQRDEEIKEQIRQCFTTTDDHGIDQLDAVALVEPATSLRLTPTHRYILESTLSLFGKDIDENMFMLLPFADEGTPGTLNALEKLQVNFKKHFNFNNVGLFDSKASSTPPSVRDMIKKQYWEMGRDSFRTFVEELDNVHPKSLKLSAETLNERRALDWAVTKIQDNISLMVQKLSITDRSLQRDTDSTDMGKETFQLAAKTTDEIRIPYWKAGETLTSKQAIEKNELNRCQDETLISIYEASQCVARLREIALRPTMSTVDYIETLISKENTEHRTGWEQRQEQLKLLKIRAEIYKAVAQTQSVTEKYVRMYNEEKRKVLSLALICQSKSIILF